MKLPLPSPVRPPFICMMCSDQDGAPDQNPAGAGDKEEEVLDIVMMFGMKDHPLVEDVTAIPMMYEGDTVNMNVMKIPI